MAGRSKRRARASRLNPVPTRKRLLGWEKMRFTGQKGRYTWVAEVPLAAREKGMPSHFFVDWTGEVRWYPDDEERPDGYHDAGDATSGRQWVEDQMEKVLANKKNPGGPRGRKPAWLREYERGFSEMSRLVGERLRQRPFFVWHEGTLPEVTGDGYGSPAEKRLQLRPESSGKRWAAGYLYAPTGMRMSFNVGPAPSVLADSHDRAWAKGAARDAARKWPSLRRRLEETGGHGLALSVVLAPYLKGQYPLSPRSPYLTEKRTPSLAEAKASFERWALEGARRSEATTRPYYWTGGLKIPPIPSAHDLTPTEELVYQHTKFHEHGTSWPPYYGQGNWIFPGEGGW